MTTQICKHCRQEIEPGPDGRPISTLSGDDGGTYDICPDAPPRYENDVEPPHEAEVLNEAEVIARVTGSRGATVRHEHRDPVTGELVTDSVVTYGDVEPTPPTLTPEQQEAVEHLRTMATEAAKTDTKVCVWGGEKMLYLPFNRALVPGHIYSMGGIAEARISGSCEYHFDRAFQPGWVDAVTGEPGLTPAED